MADNVALLVRDGAPNAAHVERSAVVAAPTITQVGLPSGTIGLPYNQLVQAMGSAANATVTEGTLPQGLVLNASTRRITGIPTFPERATFTITLTNSEGSDSKELQIVIPNQGVGSMAPTPTVLRFDPSTAELDRGGVIDLVAQVLDQNDRPIPNIEVVIASEHPSIATVSEVLPADEFGEVSVQVTGVGGGDARISAEVDGIVANPAQVFVNPTSAPTITTETMPAATVGVAYSVQLVATGYPEPNWTLLSGSLPPGMTLSPLGILSGTPTGSGTTTYTFTIGADNEEGSDQQVVSITVSLVMVPPTVTTTVLPTAVIGLAYSVALQASGGVPIQWTLSGGSLPPGLDLVDGVITGIPTADGPFAITVTATNASGTSSRTLSLQVDFPTGRRLRITSVHPDVLDAENVGGIVFWPPTPGKRVGSPIGEFNGRQFHPLGEGAELVLMLSDIGGQDLRIGDKPKVYIEGMDDATHIFEVEVTQ